MLPLQNALMVCQTFKAVNNSEKMPADYLHHAPADIVLYTTHMDEKPMTAGAYKTPRLHKITK